jgi:hypothetical protein
MKPDEAQILEALKNLSAEVKAPPDFVEKVMRKSGALQPQKPLFGSLLDWFFEPWSVAARFGIAAIVLLLMIGAVPQYLTWFNSMFGRHPADALALMQAKLWQRNEACHSALNVQGGNKAYAFAESGESYAIVHACPSGDILVQVSSAKDGTTKRLMWVPFDDANSLSLSHIFPSVVGTAFADETPLVRQSFRVAQAIRVLCSRRLPNGLIKRRVALRDGRCADEFIDPYSGQVVETRPAPCTCAQF